MIMMILNGLVSWDARAILPSLEINALIFDSCNMRLAWARFSGIPFKAIQYYSNILLCPSLGNATSNTKYFSLSTYWRGPPSPWAWCCRRWLRFWGIRRGGWRTCCPSAPRQTPWWTPSPRSSPRESASLAFGRSQSWWIGSGTKKRRGEFINSHKSQHVLFFI